MQLPHEQDTTGAAASDEPSTQPPVWSRRLRRSLYVVILFLTPAILAPGPAAKAVGAAASAVNCWSDSASDCQWAKAILKKLDPAAAASSSAGSGRFAALEEYGDVAPSITLQAVMEQPGAFGTSFASFAGHGLALSGEPSESFNPGNAGGSTPGAANAGLRGGAGYRAGASGVAGASTSSGNSSVGPSTTAQSSAAGETESGLDLDTVLHRAVSLENDDSAFPHGAGGSGAPTGPKFGPQASSPVTCPEAFGGFCSNPPSSQPQAFTPQSISNDIFGDPELLPPNTPQLLLDEQPGALTSAPEPGTLALLGIGLLAAAAEARRRQRARI